MTDSHETMRDLSFIARLMQEAEEGRPFALASIFASKGSMPRGASARMALLGNGSWLGTIGGGHIEQMAQERCKQVLEGKAPSSLEWITHIKNGMACGGDALVGVRLAKPEAELPFLHQLGSLIQSGEHVVLQEDWSHPQEPKIKILDKTDLAARDSLATITSPTWDELHKRYAEPLGADPVAYLFGGGHVGCALTPVLASVGFRVVVFDDRPDIAIPERFPAAERVICGDFTKLDQQICVSQRDFAVVLTHGHAGDIDVLEQLWACRPAYVGCIGSKNKAAFARKELARRGVNQAWLEAVHLPIGEKIKPVTPSEIAISIAAEMIRCRAELAEISQ